MAAIPRDEICFKINPKLGSIGPQLQYSKYASKFLKGFYFILFETSFVVDKLFALSRIMDLALDKANREIILPVIQRSVTIASRTTKELILKVTF
jgi:hypothetical protein